MSLLEYLKERLRPELPVRQDILDREKRFNEVNSSRESSVLNTMYLCEGDLKALKQHPDFDAVGQGVQSIVAYYESPRRKKGPCKKVTVNIPLDSGEKVTVDLIERKLKLDLHSRGCNAGVFYKRYEKGNSLYAEAVPARLTGE